MCWWECAVPRTRRRVLFVTHSLGTGGSERVTVSLANHFAERGCSVTLVPLSRVNTEYQVHHGVSIDRGMPQGGRRFARGWRKLRYLRSIIDSARPDAVVSLGAGYVYLSLISIFARTAMITSVRNDPAFLLRKHPLRRISYRLAFLLSSRIALQTRGALDFFGPRIRKKAVVIDNPLPGKLTHNPAPFASRQREIVSFGRFVPQKRLDVLIEAFDIFRKSHPDFRLALFGRGPELENIVAMVRGRGLERTVSIEDFRKDIHDRIRKAAMFVSTSDVEGMSNSMLEAMAIGLPAVCTDCPPGGSRETIEKYGTGLLARIGNPENVAEQMSAIAGCSQLADGMIASGVRLAQDLDIGVVGDTWLALAESVIAEKSRSTRRIRTFETRSTAASLRMKDVPNVSRTGSRAPSSLREPTAQPRLPRR